MSTPNTKTERGAQLLSARQVDAAKPGRHSDGNGLFLIVAKNGTKRWCTVYLSDGKPKQHPLGYYPAMSLADARTARGLLRQDVRAGKYPEAPAKPTAPASESFETLATERHERKAAADWSKLYARQRWLHLKRFVFPRIGHMAIGDIKRADVRALLHATITESGKSTADQVRQYLDRLFDEWVDEEPATRFSPVSRLMAKDTAPDESEPQPAVLEIEAARDVLATIEGAALWPSMKLYHRFMALTGMRPTEAREAEWSEFKQGVWTIPKERMKGRRGRKRSHTVFLSTAAQEVIEAALKLAPKGAKYVFGSDYQAQLQKPIHRGSMPRCMARLLGARVHTAHGWRATISTILNQRHSGAEDARQLIDAMLAHQSKSAVEARYNRTTSVEYREQTHKLANEWAALLLVNAPPAEALLGAANVVPFKLKLVA
jgi:integrase